MKTISVAALRLWAGAAAAQQAPPSGPPLQLVQPEAPAAAPLV